MLQDQKDYLQAIKGVLDAYVNAAIYACREDQYGVGEGFHNAPAFDNDWRCGHVPDAPAYAVVQRHRGSDYINRSWVQQRLQLLAGACPVHVHGISKADNTSRACSPTPMTVGFSREEVELAFEHEHYAAAE